MAMPATVRQINAARALERLRERGSLSRADLARELDVTRSTAGRIAGDLIREGRVREEDGPDGARGVRSGRPSIRLRLDPDHALFLGADMAAGHLRLAVVDFTGALCHLSGRPVDSDRPGDMADALAETVAEWRAGVARPAAIRGLNVSVPGIANRDGEVLQAPPLGWRRVPLAAMLRDRLEGVALEGLVNDANAFAVAARTRHGAEALTDAVFLFIDEGVGACLLSGGRPVAGRDGFAGEMGHIPMGIPGFCGHAGVEGAFESFVARHAILARHAASGGRAATFEAFLDLLAAGEPAALEVARDWAEVFGRGMAILTAMLDPQAIVVGGRVAPLLSHAGDMARAAMEANLMPAIRPPALERADMGPEGTAIGAALMLHRAHFAAPGDLGAPSL